MFEKAGVRPLFPTWLWLFDLAEADARTLNADMAQAIEALEPGGPKLRQGQTWQTRQDLHDLPAFSRLVPVMRGAASAVLDKLEVRSASFEITGCWANVGPPGAPHQGHTHANNYLSGVYYVQTPQGGDTINFHDPRPQTELIAPPVVRQNEFNATMTTVPVQAGRVVVFPSWLGHSVSANRSPGIRISIAFNIMFARFAETLARPRWDPAETR